MKKPLKEYRDGERLAQIVSNVTNPLFVALPTFLLIALSTSPDTPHALLWWAIIAAGVSIAPLLFVRRGVRRGKYSDHHVSIREQRFVPLLFGLGCMLIVFLLLFLLAASRALITAVIAVIVTCILALIITRYSKISLHLVGMAGAVTVCVLLYGPLCLLLTPLVLLVGWARWRVQAHTIGQAIAGTILAVSVTVLLFWASSALF